MTFYNAEFVYYNRMNDAVERFTMRNLVSKRLMQVRRIAFTEGLFIPGTTTEEEKKKLLPFVAGVVIPPADIKGIILTVIAIKDDVKEEETKG